MLFFMDMQQDQKLGKFLQAIHQDAEERRARILAEAEAFNKAELEKAEEEALTEVYHLIQEETAHMRAAVRRDQSQKELKLHRELLQKRKEIVDRVFSEAKERIRNFTATPDYPAYLGKVMEEAAPLFSEGNLVIYMRPDDLPHADVVTAPFGGRARTEADPSILLGGLRIACPEKNLMADETLDLRLIGQHVWFEKTAGLTVR